MFDLSELTWTLIAIDVIMVIVIAIVYITER